MVSDSYRVAALSEVAKIDRTVSTKEECKTLPYVGLEHIEKNAGRFIHEFNPEPEELLANKFKFTSQHVLYGKLRPYLNKVVLPNFEGVCTTEILPVLPNPEYLDRRYLWLVLFLPEFVAWASNSVSGANLPRLGPKELAKYPIPLPPLEEQRRIANIAMRADRLRRTRRYTQQLSDTYLQSVFLEMFGDPVSNPKGWEIVKLSKIGVLDRGVSKHRPRNDPSLLGGPYPLIQTGDVANSEGYIRSYYQTYSEIGLKQSKIWPKGTLCITIAANIAKTGILEFDACFPDSVVGFQPGENTNIEFVQFWFSFLQKILEETAPESAQKNINLEILRGLDIILPPLPLQQKFATIVQRFQRLRNQQQEADRQAEHLFQSILHRAFRGEL